MENKMKKRWISLYVENQVVLSGKLWQDFFPERHIIWTV